jgi:hypothetical protein
LVRRTKWQREGMTGTTSCSDASTADGRLFDSRNVNIFLDYNAVLKLVVIARLNASFAWLFSYVRAIGS